MKRPPESERSDWTEQDLLTREEASKRLDAEITEVSARMERLGQAGPGEREPLQSRLRALREIRDSLAES